MEQIDTISVRPFTDTSTNINEMHSDRDKILPSPSPQKKRNTQAILKSANNHSGFSPGSNLSSRQSGTPQQNAHKANENHPKLQRTSVASIIFSHVKSKLTHPHKQPSAADIKLQDIIRDLGVEGGEDQHSSERDIPETGCLKWVRLSQKFLTYVMEQPKFHYVIIVLIIIDLILVFVDLIIAQLSLACLTDAEMIQYNTTKQRDNCLLPPSAQIDNVETALYYISLVLISIFVLEIFTAFYAFGWRRFTRILFLIDAFIVLVSFFLEVYFHFGAVAQVGDASAGIVVLRMWKIIRAVHAVAHAVTLRNHLIIEEIEHARQIVNEEKLRAEDTIEEQQDRINHLTELLQKPTKQSNSQQQSTSTVRRRANSLSSITFF